MRRGALPSAKPCDQCHLWYFGRPNQKYCRVCAEKRKRQSDYQTHRGRPQEPLDLSSAEIEAKFQAALKEIRAARTYTVEHMADHKWKYQEPGR